MADKTVATQEGDVTLGAPTAAAPVQDVVYSSPLMEKEAAAALAQEASEVFRGEDWSGLPNFYCPLCPFSTLDGDVAVLNHGAARHPGQDMVAAAPEFLEKHRADVAAETAEREAAEAKAQAEIEAAQERAVAARAALDAEAAAAAAPAEEPAPTEGAEAPAEEKESVTNG